MANAIKKISVQRGHDVTGYLLNCFGGAGGQHACLVADALGMESVLIHPFSGLLSAYGIGLSTVFASRQQGLMEPLAEKTLQAIEKVGEALSKEIAEELGAQGVAQADIAWRPMLHIRYGGTDTSLPVDFSSGSLNEARKAFEAAHKAQFGFIYDNKEMIVEAVAVEGSDARSRGRNEPDNALKQGAASAGETRRFFAEGAWHDAAVYRREEIAPGERGEESPQRIDRRGRILGIDDRRRRPCEREHQECVEQKKWEPHSYLLLNQTACKTWMLALAP